MTTVGTLYAKTLSKHKAAEKSDFMMRYKQGKISLADHYRHLSQLLPIYAVIESKINSPDFGFALPAALVDPCRRKLEIEADLAFLEKVLPRECQGRQIFTATHAYVAYLENRDLRKDHGLEMLGHFLVRLLGDLNGGIELRKNIRNAFHKKNIKLKDVNDGTRIFNFPQDTLHQFNSWIKTLDIRGENEELLSKHMNTAIEKHMPIFAALELNAKSHDGSNTFWRAAPAVISYIVASAIFANHQSSQQLKP